jgi:hypothetical protein
MPREPASLGSRSKGAGVGAARRDAMDRDKDLPHEDQSDIEAEADRSRAAEESIPEPGTDPLHEGP